MNPAPPLRADDRAYDDEFGLDYDPTFARESSFAAEDYPAR
jgi:hypothetical protein